MAKGIILRSKGYGYGTCLDIAKAAETELSVWRADRRHRYMGETVLFRWGYRGTLPPLGKAIKLVVNEARAMTLTSNKTEFRRVLNKAKLCPPTWFMGDEIKFYKDKDVIVRPSHHEQGNDLYRCETAKEIASALGKCGDSPYATLFIDKTQEFRVFVVSGRAAWVAEKPKGEGVAWNFVEGRPYENVKWGSWPLRVVKASIQAMALSGLDFGAVDVMIDKDGTPYVLEINTAPSIASEYRAGCVAKCFDYIMTHGKETIPLVKQKGGYLKFIHPAIDPKALV